MLTLFTSDDRNAAQQQRGGQWYELAPGPDDGRYWASDGAYFRSEEWVDVAEPILAHRFPDYDRHGRVSLNAEAWQPRLAHLDNLCMRLKQADEPAMIPVEASDLPLKLIRQLERGYPAKRDELVRDLEALACWCRAALRRWRGITIIGL